MPESNQENITPIESLNKAIGEVTTDDKGKLVFPEAMDPTMRLAVTAEKKYRDTQSSYTKGQMTLNGLEAENLALREQLTKGIVKPLELTPEETTRLDDLKFTAPDEWRKEINLLEAKQQESNREEVGKMTEGIRTQADEKYEGQRRVSVLEEFNRGRTMPLTDTQLMNDIPPSISNKLGKGDITFEQFLAEADVYLSKGKTVKNPDNPTLPDLQDTTGSSTPSKNGEDDNKIDYASIVF